MQIDEYIKLGNLLKDVEAIVYKIDFQKPKNRPINKRHTRSLKSLCNLKSDLEELMFFEHHINGNLHSALCTENSEADLHVFYGTNERFVFDGKTWVLMEVNK